MSTLDQYAVIGDNDAIGDSVYLVCRRCADTSRPEWSRGSSLGLAVANLRTNHWDDPPTVATLQDLFRLAREHDATHHGSFTGHPDQADTGEINIVRGRE